MITDFNLDTCRDSAVIYKTMYKIISRKYQRGKYEEAAEMALAFLQVSLMGETTTDDEDIQDLCEPYLATSQKNMERYESKVENTKLKRLDDLRLLEIADLRNQGLSARQIEEQTGIPKSTVDYRLKIINKDYPELLDTEGVQVSNKSVQLSNVSKVSNTDTDTDTETDNDTETDTLTDTCTENETYNETVVAFSDKPKTGFATQTQPRAYENFVY